jgi:hypothetical protein
VWVKKPGKSRAMPHFLPWSLGESIAIMDREKKGEKGAGLGEK